MYVHTCISLMSAFISWIHIFLLVFCKDDSMQHRHVDVLAVANGKASQLWKMGHCI